MADDDNIVMPEFAPVADEPTEPTVQLPIEEVELDAPELIAPVFVQSSYNPNEEVPTQPTQPEESAPPKRRGRRPGSKNRPKSEVQLENPNLPLTSALRRKTDQELSQRAQGILIGATKIPSVINPHIEMRQDEAQAIADPLVSYAKAHVDSERIEQFVEQWDLIAVGIASAAYGMRVVKETRDDPNIGRRVQKPPRPRVVQAVQDSGQSEQQQPVEQGSGYQQFSEDANFHLPPSEPYIGEL